MSNANVVRTGSASVLQTSQYVGKAMKKLPNTTLNQKLNIFADADLTDNDRPFVQYVSIGNGGHGFIAGTNGRVKWKGLGHEPRHTALYNQVPFILRTLDNDLTATERLKYRLRRLENHHDIDYVAYYLRVLDLSTTEVELEIRTVVDGVTTAKPYVPTIEDMNPVPPSLTAGEQVTTTGDYLSTSAKVPFIMTADEVEEFVNAMKIINGEDGYAVISEMATCSGVDRQATGSFGGGSQTYVEAAAVQITSFIETAFVMEYQTDGIKLNLDVGNVEPLTAG